MCLVYPMLPVSMDCPLLIASIKYAIILNGVCVYEGGVCCTSEADLNARFYLI